MSQMLRDVGFNTSHEHLSRHFPIVEISLLHSLIIKRGALQARYI